MKDISANAQVQASSDQNRPIEIYDVYLDSGTLHLTDHHDNFLFWTPEGAANTTYLPLPIERGDIQQDTNAKASKVSVKLANINQGMASYAASNELRGKKVTIRRVFLDQVISEVDAVFIIKDALIDSYVITEAWLETQLISSLGTLNIEAPKWHYQLLCNRSLGDVGCAVSLTSSDNKKSKTAGSGSTTTTINSSGITEADDYFLDGYVHITSGDLAGQKRRVASNTAGSVTVMFGFPSAPAAGVTFDIYRGCDKSFDVCKNRFNNAINYGGFDTIPQELVRR